MTLLARLIADPRLALRAELAQLGRLLAHLGEGAGAGFARLDTEPPHEDAR